MRKYLLNLRVSVIPVSFNIFLGYIFFGFFFSEDMSNYSVFAKKKKYLNEGQIFNKQVTKSAQMLRVSFSCDYSNPSVQ